MLKLNTIVLYGSGQCGKTHSLNYLAEKLIKEPNVYLLEKSCKKTGLANDDNYYAMLFNIGGRDVLVIITTQGDFEVAEKDNYKFVRKHADNFPEIDIYWFTASRTKGGSADFISQTHKTISESSRLYWFCKGYIYPTETNTAITKMHEYTNRRTADSLFDMLKHLVLNLGEN